MNEATVIKTMELPGGQRWALYADANVIVLSPHLNRCERYQAIDEVCDHWRRSTLAPPFGHEVLDAASAQPLASMSAAEE